MCSHWSIYESYLWICSFHDVHVCLLCDSVQTQLATLPVLKREVPKLTNRDAYAERHVVWVILIDSGRRAPTVTRPSTLHMQKQPRPSQQQLEERLGNTLSNPRPTPQEETRESKPLLRWGRGRKRGMQMQSKPRTAHWSKPVRTSTLQHKNRPEKQRSREKTTPTSPRINSK